MNWSFLITFGVGVGVYLFVIGIIALLKFFRNKKKLKKDEENYNNEQKQD